MLLHNEEALNCSELLNPHRVVIRFRTSGCRLEHIWTQYQEYTFKSLKDAKAYCIGLVQYLEEREYETGERTRLDLSMFLLF